VSLPLTRTAPATRKIVYSRAGLPIDVSGERWNLHDICNQSINWALFPDCRPETLQAAQDYIIFVIETLSPDSATSTFHEIRRVISQSHNFLAAERNGEVIPARMFTEMRAKLGEDSYVLARVRQFYLWAADLGYSNFLPGRSVRNRTDAHQRQRQGPGGSVA
jgi:hypothetical protein